MSTVVDPIADRPTDRRSVLLVVSGLMLVMLLASLDQTIVSTALPTIVGELGGLEHLSWVVTAYLLAVTVVTPLYGKLGDLYGRKIVLQGALVIFLDRLGAVRAGAGHDRADRVPRDPGARRRRADGERAGGDRRRRAAARARQVHGPVRRRVRRLERRRAADRRLPHHAPVVALDLLRQPAARHRSRSSCWPSTLPRRRERVQHAIDYVGTALLAVGAERARPADHAGRQRRYDWGSPQIVGAGRGRASSASSRSSSSSARAAEPILPPRAVPQPRVRGHERGRPRRRLRAVRRADVPAALPAGRARRHARPSRGCSCCR